MKLSMTVAQKQILSQRMQQSAEILQMGMITLCEYMQNVAIENPVIEWDEISNEQEYDKVLKKLEWLDATDEQNKRYYQEEKEDQEENDDWKFKQQEEETLEEYLLFQINTLPITTKQRNILSFLVKSIKEDGYLEEDTLMILKEKFHITEQQAQQALKYIQSLEPAGVGARNLQECLLLQIKRQPQKCPLCEKIINQYLEILAKNQLHIIAKELKVKIVEVVEASEIIKKLCPKPGIVFPSKEKTEYIIPDIIIKQKEDTFLVIINDKFLPKLKINGYYKEILLQDTSPAAKEYITTKVKQAEWAMQCIARRETTLIKIAECIVQLQKPFFQQKNEGLLPMRLYDVAQKTGVHESTVSRAIKEKYLQCYKGIFPLSYFFSTSVSTKSEKMLSSDNVKKMIVKMINEEDKKKPFSDKVLAEKLSKEGVEISRRTIAKYRDALGIAGASKRKLF